MEIRTGMHVGQRLEQRLVMTHQLQQAIRLLQLSRTELVDSISEALAENPLLEEAPPVANDGAMSNQITGGEGVVQSIEGPAATRERTEIDWQSYFADLAQGPTEGIGSYRDQDEERPALAQTLTRAASLGEVMEEQLGTTALTPLQREIALDLIGNLDDDGYFRPSRLTISAGPEPVRAMLLERARTQGLEVEVGHFGFSLFWLADKELELWQVEAEARGCQTEVFAANSTRAIAALHGATPAEVHAVLDAVRGLDPPGVAARDLRDCLLVQARQEHPRERRLLKLIEFHLPDIEARNREAIRRDLRCTPDELERLMGLLGALEPRPGRLYNGESARYITPDVYVVKLGEEYVVVLNEDGLPRLRVSKYYQDALTGQGDDSAKEYLADKMRAAQWMIRSIQQRQSTIQRVTESIMKFQRPFLDLGVDKLRPLVLRDVAEDVGLHESTVSRVTTAKYVHTPQGIYELKFFFNSRIAATGGGDDMAAEAVRGWIKRLIDKELPSAPLSDQEIADILAGHLDRGRVLARLECTDAQVDALRPSQPITIARRTVAKYREAMDIEPSSRRRKVF